MSTCCIPTRSVAIETEFDPTESFVRTAGYATAGDGGGALYRKVGGAPSHAGKFQSADGAWWEIAETSASVRSFGCLGLTDDKIRFAEALAWSASYGSLRVGAGETVKIDSPLGLAAPTVRVSGAPGSTLDMSGGGTIVLNPGISALPDLSQNIDRGATVVSFATSHGLAEGDVFLIYNPTNYSQAPFRTYYRAGRMFRVAAVLSTTQVRIFGTARRTFVAANFDVYKLNGGPCEIEGVTIIPPTSGIPLQIDGFNGVRLKNITCEAGAADTAIDLWRCYDVHIEGLRSTVLNGDAYPVVLANCQKGAIVAPTGQYSSRHCIAFGGRDDDGCVPTADFTVFGAVMDNVSSNGIGAADIHGGCEDITYDNCVLEGANIAGRNPTLRNCTIYGRSPQSYADGNIIYGSEIVGGTYTIENCRLITSGDNVNFGSVAFDISKRTEPLSFVLRNNTFENDGSNPATMRLLHLLVGGGTPPVPAVRIEIDGLYCRSPSLGQVISLEGTNDMTATLSGEVRNLSVPSGAMPVGASIVANYGLPIRFPGVAKGTQSRGDTSVQLNPRSDVQTQVFDTALTANRAVTFNTYLATEGDRFEIIRTAGGAYTLDVLGVSVAQNERVEVVYRGPAAGLGAYLPVAHGPRI